MKLEPRKLAGNETPWLEHEQHEPSEVTTSGSPPEGLLAGFHESCTSSVMAGKRALNVESTAKSVYSPFSAKWAPSTIPPFQPLVIKEAVVILQVEKLVPICYCGAFKEHSLSLRRWRKHRRGICTGHGFKAAPLLKVNTKFCVSLAGDEALDSQPGACHQLPMLLQLQRSLPCSPAL